MGEPIPNSNTDSNTDNKKSISLVIPKIKNFEEIKDLVVRFYDYQYERYPKQLRLYKDSRNKLVNDSIYVIDKLIRVDQYSFEEIHKKLQFAVKDDFWKDKILSLVGLRRKAKNGMSKFNNIQIKKGKYDWAEEWVDEPDSPEEFCLNVK
jgi:hypothetical protein